ncbi:MULTISPECIES: hypothetical protein [unclassified Mesorhizobium]|uniref:hypothetical protein n=1 Tax=unclassified Mesorhizobium TaxID=325217 RepID=UPI001CCF0760|nr:MULTISPECIES: hypothetical protein [unclassified Mesorhizobium]MBZ9737974.1 hypothetical protein [Mesorhizobium sp. CO1-1-4]MBZ9801839.1 hypothetical protein [Mesorhizobium sp. ES1-6]
MALTLDAEQKLAAVGLVGIYNQHSLVWNDAARQAYVYIKAGFPNGAAVRPDDVAKAIKPVLEVNEILNAHLNVKRLTQKYWISYFADLIIDRAWAAITTP